MENSIEQIFELNELKLEESLVLDSENFKFWHSNIVDKFNVAVAGGFSENLAQARKIAVAELLERLAYESILAGSTDQRQAWGLNEFPTACGFAGGFRVEGAIQRSYFEAAERWLMSQWIDHGYRLESIDIQEIGHLLDPASRYFIKQFEEVLFFRKVVKLPLTDLVHNVEVVQTMGLAGNGIFPGSSARVDGKNWQHALLESTRHLLSYRNSPVIDQFPDNKVRFFAQNADTALRQIENANNDEWKDPELLLTRSMSLFEGNFHVARTIFKGWQSWNYGPIERFLY